MLANVGSWLDGATLVAAGIGWSWIVAHAMGVFPIPRFRRNRP